MTVRSGYVLGHDDTELARLEQQAAVLAPATRAILGMAGIKPGMRVLDLGTGAGDVALLVAEMVGASGSVVGVDQDSDVLGWAAERSAARGFDHVSFVEGDVHDVDVAGPFDAVVERLALLYVPDVSAVLARYIPLLASGGLVAAMEFEMHAAGTLPALPLASLGISWVIEAFKRVGHDPALGARLRSVFEQAGLPAATVLGIQGYLPPDDRRAGEMGSGIIRSLLPAIERTGIATAAEVDIDTLAVRLNEELSASGAIFKPPVLVGAWVDVSD